MFRRYKPGFGRPCETDFAAAARGLRDLELESMLGGSATIDASPAALIWIRCVAIEALD